MNFFWTRPKTVKDLYDQIDLNFDINFIRQKHKVLIVDDQDNPKKDLLIKHGYQTTQKYDIDDLGIFLAYTIIICDIQGVGKAVGGRDGGHLISEIKKMNPLKPVIAYSGQTFNPEFNEYLRKADLVLKKDSDLQEWIEQLDEVAKNSVNPIAQWKELRKVLLQKDVSPIALAELEDKYVRGVLKGKPEQFLTSKEVSKLNPELIEMIRQIVVQLIVKAIAG